METRFPFLFAPRGAQPHFLRSRCLAIQTHLKIPHTSLTSAKVSSFTRVVEGEVPSPGQFCTQTKYIVTTIIDYTLHT